jgi:hypothetical protein
VSADAVAEIRRDGRGWALLLGDGRTVRIAASAVKALRGRGWMSKAGAATLAG